MPIKWIKRTGRRLRRDLNTTLSYIRMNLEGNKVERITDFTKCAHPVLLLYGFGATRRSFSILERRLRKDGFCIFSLNLGGLLDTFNTRCIEDLAAFVKKKIERLCNRYDLGKISIIGHSKGGLIGHYYVKRLQGSERVRTLITLGTPHNGNPWALLGAFTPIGLFSKSVWQMIPRSPFIKRLKEGPFPKDVHFASIYSKSDKVCYYPGAILGMAEGQENLKNIELPGLNHADYVIRKSAYEAIRRELLTGEKPAHT